MKCLLTSLNTGLTLIGLCSAAPAFPVDAVENKIAPESEISVKPTPPQEPLVKKISESVYQIGKITLNKETRNISLPAQTNIVNPESVTEYLLVHINGEKVHESLLVTEADPTHVHLALKLLNYKESKELFRLEKADGTPSNDYPVVADEIKKAARFSIHISWKEGDTTKTEPLTQWTQHRVTKTPMPNTPWVYNGSYVYKKKFNAKITGSIFTIYPDFGSIANYPGEDRTDDTIWFPAPNLPAEGHQVSITLKPWKN